MKLKPLTLDGITYYKAYIESEKQPLMDIRDVLIQQNQLPHAAAVCTVIALLQYLADNTEE